MKTKKINLCVAAIPLVPKKELGRSDKDVPGLYTVWVATDSTQTAVLEAAACFHQRVAVAAWEDFRFYVFCPANCLVLHEIKDRSSASSTLHVLQFQKVGEKLPRIYQVQGEEPIPFSYLIAEDSQLAAKLAAKRILHDAITKLSITKLF